MLVTINLPLCSAHQKKILVIDDHVGISIIIIIIILLCGVLVSIILPLCSAHQKKILMIDDHVGISIAGLTADARTISRSPITIKYVQNSKRS